MAIYNSFRLLPRQYGRELQLRTQTGASIVGIERSGGSVINPAPDEELQADDQVLLLGNRSQLDAATAVLFKPS